MLNTAAHSGLDERIERAKASAMLTETEKQLVWILARHRGAAAAIKSSALAAALGLLHPHQRGERASEENARRYVAGMVETLVLHCQLPIGGSRSKPQGYFLIETKEDLAIATGARWGEVYAHLRYLRVLTSKKDVARMWGQQNLALDKEMERHA